SMSVKDVEYFLADDANRLALLIKRLALGKPKPRAPVVQTFAAPHVQRKHAEVVGTPDHPRWHRLRRKPHDGKAQRYFWGRVLANRRNQPLLEDALQISVSSEMIEFHVSPGHALPAAGAIGSQRMRSTN